MKRAKTVKRDLCLIAFLQQHKGMRSVVSSKDVCRYLNQQGYALQECSMFNIIGAIKREYRLPICFLACKGYFWAESADEIKYVINDLQSRINEMTEHIKMLQSFIVN